ncbi:MAG: NAD(P)H-dependent oxidoreductase subunit E, partial [Verrucomicrobiota bacterium]
MMSAPPNLPTYGALLVPALHRIQKQFGYLNKKALEEYSLESGVPQQKLQAVASFFPHFQLTPPKKVVLRVCRDMACNLAGAGKTIQELQAIAGEDVAVEGVSCLGRCDRAAAACVTVQGAEHESYFLGRSTAELK